MFEEEGIGGMKLHKKIMLESFVVVLLAVLIFMVWNVYQGMTKANEYVPDVINEYASVDYLQHEVAFGQTYRLDAWSVIIYGIVLLLVIAIYYGVRIWIHQMLRARRGNRE